MLACILLAAGQSRRFGKPKAVTEIDGRPLIQLLQEKVLAADCGELIIVLGARSAEIEPFLLNHSRVNIVHNKDHKFGQTSSFQYGLRQLSAPVSGVWLLPVDYPFIRSDSLCRLRDVFAQHPSDIIIPTYDGKRGHPPLFPADLIGDFLALDVGLGLNTVQHRHRDRCRDCPVNDPGVIATFNTPAELAALQADLKA